MSLNTIYNKLYAKSKKTELKKKPMTKKVALSKINWLREEANKSYSNYDYALEEYFVPGLQAILQARDILRFEEPNPRDVQDYLDEITEGLDELGLDYPAEIQELQNEIDAAVEKHNELVQEFERIGVNPMTDTI